MRREKLVMDFKITGNIGDQLDIKKNQLGGVKISVGKMLGI